MHLIDDDGTRAELVGLRGRLIAALLRDPRLPGLLEQFGSGAVTLHYSPAEVEVFAGPFKTSRRKTR